MILEEGLQWKDVGIPPNDAQFIEGWNASKEDIAGIFRVPPYKIGIMKPGTVSHSSVEQSNLDFWTDCIRYWAENWEQRINMALFTPAEQRQYFVKFNADAMLRTDAKTRAEMLQIKRRNGVLNADEWRDLEDENPLPDGLGEIYIVESNMVRLDQIGQTQAGLGQDNGTGAGLGNGTKTGNGTKPGQQQNGAGTGYTNGAAH